MRETQTMVQLSPPHGLGALERPEAGVEGQGSPQPDSPRPLTSLQLALNPSSATYQGYDTYIEDGLICLKHKIRNIEKKKLKLEDYKRRLRNGDKLNGDQQDAVSRYEEVVHNLAFAKELHATLGALTHDLLKAHRKAVLREQVVQMEAERAQLSMLLQMQHVLRQLQEPHVREGLAADPRHAHLLSAQELQSLIQLASLVGTERDAGMSLESQMTHVSTVYWDLLEGKATPVMGTTYKHMKELLLRLVDCGYFDQVLPAPSAPSCGSEESAHTQTQETPGKPESLTALVKGSAKGRPPGEFLNRHYLTDPNDSGCGQDETPPSSWKVEFLALKEQEPPDSWEAEFSERPGSPAAGQHKPWRGAAGFMPKIPVTMTASGGGPRLKRQRKAKDQQEAKPAVELVSPLEKDPVERRQQLEELMDQIRGSFTFMQDSLLDGAATPPHAHSMLCRPTPSTSTPIAHAEQLKPPPELLPKALCLVSAADGTDSLTNGEASLDQPPDPPSLERTSEEPTQETRSQGEREGFTSPPLYQREPSIPLEEQNSTKAGQQSPCNGGGPLTATPPQAFSTPPSRHSLSMADPAPFQKIHSVFKLNPSEVELKTDSTSFSQPSCLPYTHTNTHRYSTASTQTSSDLNLPDEDLQPETVFQSEGSLGNVGQMYSSRLAPPCYPRGTVRGMPRAGKSSPLSYRTAGTYRGGYEGFKAGLRSPGGGYSMRETASNLYSARDAGGLQAQRRGSSGSLAQRKSSSAGWSDSSQVSSPEGDGVYLLDPCHGGDSSLSVSLPPAAPQGLMPVHVYPLAQPLRVAYSAARTANFAPGTLDQPIGFDLLHTNQGEMFEMMSGRFCCPAAGTYVFIFHILKLAVNVPLYINLMRNEEVVVSAYANDGAPDHETASNHALLQLYQGDQVWLRLHRGAIYGSSWKYSTFSGFLLYQD